MDKLRKLLLKEQFFNLQTEYGRSVPDGFAIFLTVVARDRCKSVRLEMSAGLDDKTQLQEAARALRVAKLLSLLFKEENVISMGKMCDRVIKAAER